MNLTETAKLCAAIASMVPAQKFTPDTPGFWQVPLAGFRYEDAREAVLTIVARQPFIGLNDIVTEVKRIRNDRISRSGIEQLPLTMIEYRRLVGLAGDGTWTSGDWLIEHAELEAGVPPPAALPAYADLFGMDAVNQQKRRIVTTRTWEAAIDENNRRDTHTERLRQKRALAELDPNLSATD